MIRVGIFGGAGYAAGELIRILLNHPDCEIVFIHSSSSAGKAITDIHEGLLGETNLAFTNDFSFQDVDIIFLCFGHGKSAQFLSEHIVPKHVRIIDLAQDFRLSHDAGDFVYGLPELNHDKIKKALHIANPGCFATCIQLGLLPLAKKELLHGDIIVNGITGSTGAGVKPTQTSHFSWRSGNISTYKVLSHQHVMEIMESIHSLSPQYGGELLFIPYRGDFPRGIFVTELLQLSGFSFDISALYREFYSQAPFTHYVDSPVDLKQVVNTNKCLIHIDCFQNHVVITSCIDNLLKGAAGQAVENMNLMFGLDETTGLKLKSLAF